MRDAFQGVRGIFGCACRAGLLSNGNPYGKVSINIDETASYFVSGCPKKRQLILAHLVLYGAAVSAAAAVVVPGDAVGVAVPVPGEVAEEEAAPHRVARHPTKAPTGLSIQSAATEGKCYPF